MIEGIDLSAYQGYVDWRKVYAAGKRFAFMKATEGLGYHDPTFEHNWYASKKRGLYRGAYHYFWPNESAAEQADYLHAFVRDSGRFVEGDAVCLDVEETAGLNPSAMQSAITEFVLRAAEQIDKQIVIYTTRYFWLTAVGNLVDHRVSRYPIWLADWGSSAPTPPTAWPVASFWQYSSTGYCNGINGQVDLDRFLGTEHQLREVMYGHG